MANTYIFDMPSIIATKRDGAELSPAAIDWLIGQYTSGDIGEEQVAALLMAIYLRGMNGAETAAWTAAILASGERLDLSGLSRPTVDKHSTGGVGDKISLPLVAVVAACGAAVPQLSGRGLGHTGGTLDKLESVAGIRVDLSNDQIRQQLSDVGAVICAAGASLAPADRKLYALRDITGTVESIPLIAGSIMSKKLAEGTAALVLDVKVGAGAFMKSEQRARELASAMVDLGTAHGVATSALLTAMDTPLGPPRETRSRCRNRSTCWRGRAGGCCRAHRDAGPRDARGGRDRRQGSGRDADRRHRHGRVPRDDPRAGW